VLVVCTETTQQVRATRERERLIDAERRARAEADAARDAMARVFAQAPVAIAVLHGRELRFTVANARYRHMIGGRDPVGSTLVEMFPELAGSPIERVLDGVYESGKAFVADELLIRFDSQGAGVIDNYYDLVYHPVATSTGTVTGIVVVAIDVTERRQVLRDRERLLADAEHARAIAEEANRGKSEFLAIMSHELRTPLNAIGGYTELIELGIHGPVTSAQGVALGRIQQSQRHLLGLINGILNYTRVEAGAAHYAIEDVALDEVLATCEALTAPQMRARQLTFGCDGCAPAIRVRADREKMQQIVLNLMSNAIKFTPAGGRVVLQAAVAGDAVVVTVADTGRGIPSELVERVFEPFVQVDSRLTRTQDGVGLGLSISRSLARAMGGDLTVESTPGIGSSFVLTLPAARPRAEATARPSDHVPAPSPPLRAVVSPDLPAHMARSPA
jgi:signal transduction histidine kinase